jgi:hypothetical protein
VSNDEARQYNRSADPSAHVKVPPRRRADFLNVILAARAVRRRAGGGSVGDGRSCAAGEVTAQKGEYSDMKGEPHARILRERLALLMRLSRVLPASLSSIRRASPTISTASA